MADEINITQTIKKEDLTCTICYKYLNKQIFRCINGPHYACDGCNKKLNECPTCRNKTKLVRDLIMEQNLKQYLIPCQFNDKGCKEMIFKWDEDHCDTCEYSPFSCKLCNRKITGNTKQIIAHYKEFCDKTFNFIIVKNFDTTYKIKLSRNMANLVDFGNFIMIAAVGLDRTHYRIGIFSENDDMIGKKVKCKYTEVDSTYEFNVMITTSRKFDFTSRFPFLFGDEFVVENVKLPTTIPYATNPNPIPQLGNLWSGLGGTFAAPNSFGYDPFNSFNSSTSPATSQRSFG